MLSYTKLFSPIVRELTGKCLKWCPQESVVYIKWVGVLSAAGEEVATYAAADRSKLVLLGDSPQDVEWGKRVPVMFMAAKMVVMAD